MVMSGKIRCLSILLLALTACSSASDTVDNVSWSARIKQSLQPVIAWFNQHTIKSSEPVDTKVNKDDEQAQAQLMGAMETQSTAQITTQKSVLSGENVAQLHSDYDKAITADDKRDALVSLIEADANNAATFLRDAYADPDPELRKEAVLQMHAFNNQAAVIELLLTALGDPDGSVVIEAVEGLAQLEDKRAIEGLKKLATSHPDEQIRAVAQDYVDQLDATQPTEQLEPLDK
ncbi:exported hypothetical protein [Crenothrix polyspora]|uniref:HEAT repeat domain-containing protein n=2 Tax=Crenothrix polyspora TaxID=360316 RepID=A0A1R4GZ44_9GAMM|nr:exported hypothetical protein [Crenothrix polyspora]